MNDKPIEETTSKASPEEVLKGRGAFAKTMVFVAVLLGVALSFLVVVEVALRVGYEPRPLEIRAQETLTMHGQRFAFSDSALTIVDGHYALNSESKEAKRLDPEKINIALVGDNALASLGEEPWTINPVALNVSEGLEGTKRFRAVSFAVPRMAFEDAAKIIESGLLPEEVDAVVVGLGIEFFMRMSGEARIVDPHSVEAPSLFGAIDVIPAYVVRRPKTRISKEQSEGFVPNLIKEIDRIREAAIKAKKGVLIVLLPSIDFDDPDEIAYLGMNTPQRLAAVEKLREALKSLGFMPKNVRSGLFTRDLSIRETAWEGEESKTHGILGTIYKDTLQAEVGKAIGKALKETKPWLFSERQKAAAAKAKRGE